MAWIGLKPDALGLEHRLLGGPEPGERDSRCPSKPRGLVEERRRSPRSLEHRREFRELAWHFDVDPDPRCHRDRTRSPAVGRRVAHWAVHAVHPAGRRLAGGRFDANIVVIKPESRRDVGPPECGIPGCERPTGNAGRQDREPRRRLGKWCPCRTESERPAWIDRLHAVPSRPAASMSRCISSAITAAPLVSTSWCISGRTTVRVGPCSFSARPFNRLFR